MYVRAIFEVKDRSQEVTEIVKQYIGHVTQVSGPFWPHYSIMVSVWLSEGIFSWLN